MTEDGSIDVDDLMFVLGNLGTVNNKADLNKDGAVGVDDLAIVLRMFAAAN